MGCHIALSILLGVVRHEDKTIMCIKLLLLEVFDIGLNKPRTILDAIQNYALGELKHVEVLERLYEAIKGS